MHILMGDDKLELIVILKAVADETRLRMLSLLKDQELCVCEIEEVLGIQQSNASRHLDKLRNARLVCSEKKAQWVYYRINEETLQHYPFLRMIIKEEASKIPCCQQDTLRLKNAKGCENC
ncbi:MAG: ArsR/SmtB family transcription factor [Syntrophomonadaceae bacterium]